MKNYLAVKMVSHSKRIPERVNDRSLLKVEKSVGTFFNRHKFGNLLTARLLLRELAVLISNI